MSTTNATKTQKSQLYMNNDGDVLEIAQVTGMTGLGGGSSTDIDTTTLMSDAKESVSGLADNGSLSVGIIINMADTSHAQLAALEASHDLVDWCIGLSDGTAQPTIATNVMTAPTARSSYMFKASVSGYSRDIPIDNVLKGTVTLKVSGAITETAKA